MRSNQLQAENLAVEIKQNQLDRFHGFFSRDVRAERLSKGVQFIQSKNDLTLLLNSAKKQPSEKNDAYFDVVERSYKKLSR